MMHLPQRFFPGSINHSVTRRRPRLSWLQLFRQTASLAAVFSLAVPVYFLASHFVFQSLKVSGHSMDPALLDNGNYWVNRCLYLMSEPQRSDIVEVKDPQDGALVVKRIIAVPGESVYFDKGIVYVNGQRLKEPYLPPGTPTYAYEKKEDEFICCGKNQYFVLGDNRGNSTDSRTFGPVPRQDILGKVIE